MPVIPFFNSSKQVLMRFASVLDMPSLMSCFSKAFLVFRTRLPSVIYIQNMSKDMRAMYGEDLRTVDTVAPELIYGHPIMNGRGRSLFLFLMVFFVLLHLFSDSLTHSFLDFFSDFAAPAMSALASEHTTALVSEHVP